MISAPREGSHRLGAVAFGRAFVRFAGRRLAGGRCAAFFGRLLVAGAPFREGERRFAGAPRGERAEARRLPAAVEALVATSLGSRRHGAAPASRAGRL